MSTFKISANYWNKLNSIEQTFFQHNINDFTISELKAVISTLKKLKIEYNDIVNASHYTKSVFSQNNWLIFKDGKPIYMLYCNTSNIGIKQRLSRKTENGYIEIWND